MYHRIAEESVDPWGLAVSPAHFEEHLQVLRRTRYPMSLLDFVRRLAAGTLPRDAVALTFDDGYADMLFAAKPLLVRADVPATVFLITGCLDRPEEFWWDELAKLILIQDAPRTLEIRICGNIMHFDLGTAPIKRENDGWRAWSAPLTQGQKAYVVIWQALRPLEDNERRFQMAKLRTTMGRVSHSACRSMTRQQVRDLAAGGLVMIGAHTVTHPPLTALEDRARRHEIAESKKACEELVESNVAGFTYPFGDLDEKVRRAVGAEGFFYACSTRNGPVAAKSDMLVLPRMQVFDWDGDAFAHAMRLGC